MRNSIQSFKTKYNTCLAADPVFVSAAKRYKKDISILLRLLGANNVTVKIGRYYILTTFSANGNAWSLELGEHIIHKKDQPYVVLSVIEDGRPRRVAKLEMDEENAFAASLARALEGDSELPMPKKSGIPGKQK